MNQFEQYSEDAIRTAGEGDLLEMTRIIKEMREIIRGIPGRGPQLWMEFMDRLEQASQRDEHKMGLAYDALGLAGEAGEVADYMKKVIGHGKTFDDQHVEKELGDILWYINRMTRRLGKTLTNVAIKNIAKLKARYPNGFSHQASENRTE